MEDVRLDKKLLWKKVSVSKKSTPNVPSGAYSMAEDSLDGVFVILGTSYVV
mgnify:CR=1 FL=1